MKIDWWFVGCVIIAVFIVSGGIDRFLKGRDLDQASFKEIGCRTRGVWSAEGVEYINNRTINIYVSIMPPRDMFVSISSKSCDFRLFIWGHYVLTNATFMANITEMEWLRDSSCDYKFHINESLVVPQSFATNITFNKCTIANVTHRNSHVEFHFSSFEVTMIDMTFTVLGIFFLAAAIFHCITYCTKCPVHEDTDFEEVA